jgi:hypothetical protein
VLQAPEVRGETGHVIFVPIATKKKAEGPIQAFTVVWSGISLRPPSRRNSMALVMADSVIQNKIEEFLCEKVRSFNRFPNGTNSSNLTLTIVSSGLGD